MRLCSSRQAAFYGAVLLVFILACAFFANILFPNAVPIPEIATVKDVFGLPHGHGLVDGVVDYKETFEYSVIYIQAQDSQRPDDIHLPALPMVFAPKFETFDKAIKGMPDEPKKSPSIRLEVPKQDESVSIHRHSGLVVGMATDIPRLKQFGEVIKAWLHGGKVTLVAILWQHEDIEKWEQEWRDEGLDVYFIRSHDPDFKRRYMNLMSEMWKISSKLDFPIRWFGVADDDTFFPSVQRLANFLSGFDHERPFWLGTITEDKNNVCQSGFIAYGGGSMWFSSSFVRNFQPVVPACLAQDMNPGAGGDRVLSRCILEQTRERLIVVRDLHQLDIQKGAMEGVFESGWKPISIHHWKPTVHLGSIFNVPMDKAMHITKVTSDEGMFQRWRFSDNWVLTNCFSLVKYNVPLDDIDFSKTEMTWEGKFEDYVHLLGPFRKRLDDEDKETYLFRDSIIDGDRVRQIYVKAASETTKKKIIELVWFKAGI